MGSSPRVRGSQDYSLDTIENAGIIPAGAGLTDMLYAFHLDSRDHPRGCGAHLISRSATAAILGSSPRVRGSPTLYKARMRTRGIIPAGAGLTDFSRH